MRNINKIIVHCSATQKKADIGAAEINTWHTQRGFDCIGYHFVIRRDATIEHGRSLAQIGAHCRGNNAESIGICMVGGINHIGESENNFTQEQFKTLNSLLAELEHDFPNTTLHGHNEFANKDCPCFSVGDL